MKVTVKNPTARTKAVRAKGGLVTIKPNGSTSVEDIWDATEKARYVAAGLKISEGKASETDDTSADDVKAEAKRLKDEKAAEAKRLKDEKAAEAKRLKDEKAAVAAPKIPGVPTAPVVPTT